MKLARWTHGHTAVVAALAGVSVAHSVYTIPAVMLVSLTAGYLLRDLVRAVRATAAAARRRLELAAELAAEKAKTERARGTELRTRTRHRHEASKDTLKREYWRGARDGAVR